MRIFIAYKFSGVDHHTLRNQLTAISDAITKEGHESFIFFRDREKWGDVTLTIDEIITGAFEELSRCDAVLVMQQGNEKSEGVLLEAGYAKALQKMLVVAVSTDAHRRLLTAIADHVVIFDDVNDLLPKLEHVFV